MWERCLLHGARCVCSQRTQGRSVWTAQAPPCGSGQLTDSQQWFVQRDAQKGRVLSCMWLQAFVSPRTQVQCPWLCQMGACSLILGSAPGPNLPWTCCLESAAVSRLSRDKQGTGLVQRRPMSSALLARGQQFWCLAVSLQWAEAMYAPP